MSTLNDADRREYYRIEDLIALEITPLSASEAASSEVLQDASPLFNLLSELHLSEFESQHQLRQISERDRSVSSYLKTLNKRVELLSQIVAQTVMGKIGELQPVKLSEGDIEFHHPAIDDTGTHCEIDFTGDAYVRQISRARTFGFIQDVEALRGLGLAQGGNLANAIVLDEYKILNPEGLRYNDEFVKHKILDAIGDLYVIGAPILGAYTAYKSGHALNNVLIRAVLADEANYEYVTFENEANAPSYAGIHGDALASKATTRATA